MYFLTHISRDDHAAKLINDKNIQLWGRLAELLLKDLQNVFHDFGCVSKSHSDVSKWSDGVVRDQMGIPTRTGVAYDNLLISGKYLNPFN